MPAKNDAEEVKNFAFQPVGGGPDGDKGVGLVVGAECNFQTQARVVGERIKLCDQIETFFTPRPINRCVVLKQVELFFIPRIPRDLQKSRRIHDENRLLAIFQRIENRRAESLAIPPREFVVERHLHWGGSSGNGSRRLRGRSWRCTPGGWRRGSASFFWRRTFGRLGRLGLVCHGPWDLGLHLEYPARSAAQARNSSLEYTAKNGPRRVGANGASRTAIRQPKR